jgi:hypothetical protein
VKEILHATAISASAFAVFSVLLVLLIGYIKR